MNPSICFEGPLFREGCFERTIGGNLGTPKQSVTGSSAPVEVRRHPRFKLEVEVKISSKTCGTLQGYTVDISESGLSALLKLEVPLAEMVELQFKLPAGDVRVYATVRQRNAFRYGFQFVESEASSKIIQATCQRFALEQSALS
jgi:hypothetical protein